MLEIVYTTLPEEARALAARGYEPIECSFGQDAIVGPLELDHHGTRAHLESVSLRSYRDHFGARAADPRFVVTGHPDPDATFAMAALAARLPTKAEVNLLHLARLIDRDDRDPLGLDLLADRWGPVILAFQSLVVGPPDAELFLFGVGFWRVAAHGLPPELLEAMAQVEARRRDLARRATRLAERGLVQAVSAPVWGFDVWYGRRQGSDPDDPASWEHPVVVLYDEKRGKVTIGCPNDRVAARLLGSRGLLALADRLEPRGWGGRLAILGSPRGARMGPEVARFVAELAARAIEARPPGASASA